MCIPKAYLFVRVIRMVSCSHASLLFGASLCTLKLAEATDELNRIMNPYDEDVIVSMAVRTFVSCTMH